MSFIAVIPIWLGCFACYLGSDKQTITNAPINKTLANTLLILGYVAGCVLFSLSYPVASSVLAAFVVLMLGLISHTILSVYVSSLKLNAIVMAVAMTFAGVSYVA